MSEQRYRSTAGPALASMDNWNAQQNRRPAMQLTEKERAVPEPDAAGDDLDVMLDSLGADTWIYRVKRDGFGEWVATIEVVPDDYIVVGKGATRMEAIANAVKFAKEPQP